MSQSNETETDGFRLKVKFDALKAAEGMGKAEFARTFKIPGGASMISQHISGHRPIGLDAMVAYAKGFQCSIAEISPALAAQLPNSESSNQPLAHTERAQAATNNIAYLRDSIEFLAGYLSGMDATTRRRAGGLLAELSDDPHSHAHITALMEDAIRSGRPAVADDFDAIDKKLRDGKQSKVTPWVPGQQDRRVQRRRES